MSGMRASGPSGELRYGYQVAARTGKWVIETAHSVPGFTFTSRLVENDEVWISRKPLDLILMLGPFEWIWKDVDASITGMDVSILLTRRPDLAQRSLSEPQSVNA